MRRREFITLVGGAAAWPVMGYAQQPRALVAVLSPTGAVARNIDAMRQGLHDLGYDEGRNLHEAGSLDDLERAFGALTADGVEAFYVSGSPLFNRYRMEIAKMVGQAQRPSIGTLREQAVEGFVMTYGTSISDSYRHAAGYVAKILQGAKAADLPIEQPTKFELIVNVKAATALGLAVPDRLIALADEVIE